MQCVRSVTIAATLLMALSACGGAHHAGGEGAGAEGTATATASTAASTRGLPGVGDGFGRRIPAETRQAVVVYGDGKDSPDATVALYTKRGSGWERTRSWPAHNGKKGWTVDHHEGDKRSPVGVFTLTDAGGVLPDPGARLLYTRNAAFAAPRWWAESHWHDFDYVIAIDYNRVKGTPPNDPTRPDGEVKGGSIWLHMDHGSGTSGCVSLSKAAMEYLLRTLDPDRHPVVVMGDKADLKD
ncbi:L,D-transpeptidase family protein [Streptomyces pseudovenezuelae]|uniref:L,D-peptidoglycan transpeptidase YkuD (ErfK/YbiS/YcfS/YnhG family) n=1 Tax=Streptomyces pseudovenezuelae TaxID=67350 RepID=A0ABT6LNW6_9ACTN|nr:L,D-transpeptidase family protein [Streptomyces pseudovenezuelae]MDH6218004.1 L,D-peptidoglycan transpeptidase YkuD (ErfK/YbiS/YcfS/YnhG family) [Streptomyces pseudovenezuelae]